MRGRRAGGGARRVPERGGGARARGHGGRGDPRGLPRAKVGQQCALAARDLRAGTARRVEGQLRRLRALGPAWRGAQVGGGSVAAVGRRGRCRARRRGCVEGCATRQGVRHQPDTHAGELRPAARLRVRRQRLLLHGGVGRAGGGRGCGRRAAVRAGRARGGAARARKVRLRRRSRGRPLVGAGAGGARGGERRRRRRRRRRGGGLAAG
mmetsp:Transcript_31302/g.95297  ORF Transcript_31302/g.95297 Transcript_31302/m.95297 type:complete len:209 (+) Transcript_31302:352-978(+)